MAVKLRLMRMGKKKQPTYRVVAADSRSPRDGRFIEVVGTYAPRTEPSAVEVDKDKALAWLAKGAQPTETVRKLLVISGAWDEFAADPPGQAGARRRDRLEEGAREEGAREEGTGQGVRRRGEEGRGDCHGRPYRRRHRAGERVSVKLSSENPTFESPTFATPEDELDDEFDDDELDDDELDDDELDDGPPGVAERGRGRRGGRRRPGQPCRGGTAARCSSTSPARSSTTPKPSWSRRPRPALASGSPSTSPRATWAGSSATRPRRPGAAHPGACGRGPRRRRRHRSTSSTDRRALEWRPADCSRSAGS